MLVKMPESWPQPLVAVLAMALVLGGFQVMINNIQTLPSDFFPGSAVASVFGLGGTAAAIASAFSKWCKMSPS